MASVQPLKGPGVCMRDGAKIDPTLLLHRRRGAVRDGANRRDTMGDKGGKKDKQKEQKRKTDQKQHDAKVKQDKQPKRKTG